MTIIEVTVAMSVMGVALMGVCPSFYGAALSTASANHRAAANGLAVQATEAIRALPYYEVGFYGDQTSPAQCSGLANPVVLGPTSPSSPGPTLVPTSSATMDNVYYAVARCLDWVDASPGPGTYAQAYKRSMVFVTWTDNAGTHTISQVSAVYPAGAGAYTSAQNNYTPSTTTTTMAGAPPWAPTSATAVDAAAPADQSTINVSWTAPVGSPTAVDHYVVQYNTTGAFGGAGTYATSPAVPGTSWVASGLTSGATYWFQVYSVAADGTMSSAPSNMATATTAPSGSTGCQVSGLSVSPTSGMVDSSGHLVGATGFNLAVNASSGCSGLTVRYSTAAGTQSTSLVGSGGQMTGTAGTASTQWTAGSDAFTVYYNGTAYSPLTQQLVNICVERGNSGHC